MVAARGWGRGRNEELVFHRHRVSVEHDGKVPEMDRGDDCTTSCMQCNVTESVKHLKKG